MYYIVLHIRAGKVSTHSLCMFFKSFRLGNVIVGPFKSDILLIHKCFINEKKMFLYWRLHSITNVKCKLNVTIWNIIKRRKYSQFCQICQVRYDRRNWAFQGCALQIPTKSKVFFLDNTMQVAHMILIFYSSTEKKVMDEPKFRLTIFQVWSSSQ